MDPPRIAEDVPFMTGIASGTGGNRFDDNFDRFQSNKRKGDYDDHRGPKRTNYGMKMIFFFYNKPSTCTTISQLIINLV